LSAKTPTAAKFTYVYVFSMHESNGSSPAGAILLLASGLDSYSRVDPVRDLTQVKDGSRTAPPRLPTYEFHRGKLSW
jgi:hypothetical protein